VFLGIDRYGESLGRSSRFPSSGDRRRVSARHDLGGSGDGPGQIVVVSQVKSRGQIRGP